MFPVAGSFQMEKEFPGSATAGVSGQHQKSRQIDFVFHLYEAAEGLMAKLYKLRQILDYPEIGSHQFSDSFWKAGIIPDFPKLCTYITKKFPEHPAKLQLEKIDKGALDQLHDNADTHLTLMEPWLEVLLELMKFREQALRSILDLSSTVITLLPQQNPLILHAFMNLFCAFVRVSLLSDKIPRKMLIQTFNLTHSMLKSGRDYEFYHRLVQFVDSYDPPMKGLHDDLNFVSPRIGEILEAIGPTVFLGSDYQKLRNEGFLSPFHPRYPDKLTNSAHPARAQELANVECYRDWVLLGYLVCPLELLRFNGLDIAMAVLKDTLVLPLFRDEFILLHEEYQLYVLPKIAESKKLAKAGRAKQKDADQEYSLAKQVEKMICDVEDVAISKAESIHREQRTFLKQELSRMVMFFSDQPSLLASNIQMVFSALSMTRFEVVWYFTHVGVLSTKPRGARVVPVDIDVSDPTIGFLLDGMDKLCGLIRKYVSAVRGYALGYLAGAAERVRFLLGTPGMVALDIDSELKYLLTSVSQCLDSLQKLQNEVTTAGPIDLSVFRRNWLSIIMLVSSSRASISIRHLEKATLSTGKESIVSEGNMAYLWSRSVDDIENQLSQHSSLKVLCFYRQHLTTVFKHTMFGPEGRPQHCCAWLGIACSFPENANMSVPEEPAKLAEDAVSYAESIIESIMAGFEGLINILDSEGGFGSLEYKLTPNQAAMRMNQAARSGNTSSKSIKNNPDLPLPGSESEPSSRDSIKMLEAAVQRLTSLCMVLNEMEPVCVLSHVFVPREYLRDHIISNFQSRLRSIVKVDGGLQRPSVLEALLHRHLHIVHLIEQHLSMDLSQGIREVLLSEAFSGPMRDLQNTQKMENVGGALVSNICEWYVENIVKDVTGAGVVFTPLDRTFRSGRPVEGNSADAVAGISELKAFIRIFGPYGLDRFDSLLRGHLSALLNFIDITLHANKEALESLATNIHKRFEHELSLKKIVELENFVAVSLQVGNTLSFRSLLTEAAAEVLGSNVPLIFNLLSDFVKYAPLSIPERQEIHKLKTLASRIGINIEQDTLFVHSVLVDIAGAGDSAWVLVPYLYVACMKSHIWNSSAFSIYTGGFNSNVHSLARCINAVAVANEFVRSEDQELQRQLSQQQSGNVGSESRKLESEALSLEGMAAVDASIKSMLKTFVQCSAALALDGWSESNRSPLVAKLIFLDQLCELSKYLPRSTLESHVPHTILRSIYQLYYENAVPTLVLTSPSSRRHVTAPSSSYVPTRNSGYVADSGHDVNEGGPSLRGSIFSGSMKLSAQRKKQLPDMESVHENTTEDKHSGNRGVRLSGPLDYNGARKVSFAEGVNSNSAPVPSPLKRFAVSRSGPLIYKSQGITEAQLIGHWNNDSLYADEKQHLATSTQINV